MLTSDDKVGGWVKKGQNHNDVILEWSLSKTIEARNQSLSDKKPILLKIAPDLSQQDKIDICDVILNNPKVRLFIFPQILFHKTNFV